MKKQVQVHACIIYMPCPTCPSTFTCSTCLTCWLCSFTCITCYFACFTCLFTCFACSFTCSTCSFAWSNMFDMVFYMFIHGWHVLWHVPACTWYSMDIILLISTQRILKIGSSRLRHANIVRNPPRFFWLSRDSRHVRCPRPDEVGLLGQST